MFKVDDNSPSLNEKKSETLYKFVMKVAFLVKRARPDLEPGFGIFIKSKSIDEAGLVETREINATCDGRTK